ncbi:MAG: hypothetical protein QOK42_1665 [Frankiaceae bacterium]|nr:hypothetical protein [Frankiaceae bacterium]
MPKLPGHVAVIVIENHSYDDAYVNNTNPYLKTALPKRGTLLTQYYGVGHASLDNYIAMVSGQEPNPSTQADCTRYVDVVGVTTPAGQNRGAGCVYPADVKTLGDQLDAQKLSWRGYMEDMGVDPTREPNRCGNPGSPALAGTQDQTQTATAKDQYAARHNPFVYFHSLLDTGSCVRNVRPLAQLSKDFAKASTTPRLSFITPDLCSDGHDQPCVDGRPGGLTSVDAFLKMWVPKILAAPAFAKDGLVIVTADEAETGDATACCGARTGSINKFAGITGPGGGRVGTVLLGPCVKPGAKSATPLDHYSLLRTLEDVYGVPHLGLAAAPEVKTFLAEATAGCKR